MRRVRVPAEIAALIQGLHPTIKRKVRAAIDEIVRDPYAGKALRDELDGLYSYRIGRMRLIYRNAGGSRAHRTSVLEIVTIGPREVIYEETLRLVRRERPF